MKSREAIREADIQEQSSIDKERDEEIVEKVNWYKILSTTVVRASPDNFKACTGF